MNVRYSVGQPFTWDRESVRKGPGATAAAACQAQDPLRRRRSATASSRRGTALSLALARCATFYVNCCCSDPTRTTGPRAVSSARCRNSSTRHLGIGSMTLPSASTPRSGTRDFTGTQQARFEAQLNQLLREQGVGWEMKQESLVARRSEAFVLATGHATEMMLQHGAPTAANENHEALRNVWRRSHADVTGAIQHAMAALECVARAVAGRPKRSGRSSGG